MKVWYNNFASKGDKFMIEKETAINILEDVERSLYSENWKYNTLSTISQYKKGLLIATNEKIKKLVEESKKYDENSVKHKKISKKIDNEIKKINKT